MFLTLQDVGSIGKDSDDESDSNEETIKKKEQHILLQEIAYETLGKAWPNNAETQSKYFTYKNTFDLEESNQY